MLVQYDLVTVYNKTLPGAIIKFTFPPLLWHFSSILQLKIV